MALIRSGEGRKGVAGRNNGQGRGHGDAMAEPHRSFFKRCFRPRFAMGIARGEREQDCELTTEVNVGGGGTEEARCSVVEQRTAARVWQHCIGSTRRLQLRMG